MTYRFLIEPSIWFMLELMIRLRMMFAVVVVPTVVEAASPAAKAVIATDSLI